MADIYDIGDGIRISALFSDLSEHVTDPTVVIFKLKNPNGQVTTPSVVHDGTGNYHADIVVDQSGTWTYRWEGDGAVQAAKEGTITVRRSKFV